MSTKHAFRTSIAAGILGLCVTLGPLVGCDPAKDAPPVATPPIGQPQAGLKTATMQIGNQNFTVEIADDEQSRETGLMNRDGLPDDRGMLFVFTVEEPLGFWMKNTRIPLDILYVDGKGKVVSVATMKPFDLTTVPSHFPAKFAIELNAGKVRQLGIKPGDLLTLPTVAR